MVSGCLLLAISGHLFDAHVSGLTGCRLEAFSQGGHLKGYIFCVILQAPISPPLLKYKHRNE